MENTAYQIWACEEKALIDYLSRREQINVAQLDAKNEAFMLAAPQDDKPIMRIEGNTAIVQISGVLSKDGPDFWESIFGLGGTSYTAISSAVNDAADNATVEKIQLEIDSPGGDVFGVDEARGAIARAGEKKKVTAINVGKTASAAYWLASAADEIVATAPTNVTGSIGVVAVAIDRNEQNRKRGVVTVVSRNAPDKRPDLQTESGRAVLQDEVDAIERAFIRRIADGRGVSVETVERDFGRGRVMIASDPDDTKPSALSVGMIDRVVDGFGGPIGRPPSNTVEAVDNAKIEAAKEAANEDEPPCAAEGKTTMSEELKSKVAELEKLLGNTTAAHGELEARMSAVAPILASDVYPAVVKAIAGKVLAGTEHPKTLEGAIAVYDAQHAEREINVAAEATNDAPTADPKPSISSVPEDGSIVSAESLDAQVKLMRQALGKE